MKSVTVNFNTLLIAIAILIIVYLQYCNPKPASTTTIINKYDSTSKTLPAQGGSLTGGSNTFNPKVEITIPPELFAQIKGGALDSQSIAQDYLKKRYYETTFSDSNIDIVSRDSVALNRLYYSQPTYKWKQPLQQTINTYNPDPALSIGAFTDTKDRNFGGLLIYQTPAGLSLGAGKDFASNSWHFQVTYKLMRHRKK